MKYEELMDVEGKTYELKLTEDAEKHFGRFFDIPMVGRITDVMDSFEEEGEGFYIAVDDELTFIGVEEVVSMKEI